MNDDFTFIGLAFFIAFMLFGWAVPAGVNKVRVGAEIAKIEQLRGDSLNISASQSEDVVGQITEINQKIVENKAYNKIPFACLYVPNEWDSVAVIEVPKNR